jgi:hypothetical protein
VKDVDLEMLVARIDKLAERADRALALTFVLNSRLVAVEARVGAPPFALDDETTIKDASFRTGYSPSSIRKKIGQGKISARKVGGRILVAIASLPGAK